MGLCYDRRQSAPLPISRTSRLLPFASAWIGPVAFFFEFSSTLPTFAVMTSPRLLDRTNAASGLVAPHFLQVSSVHAARSAHEMRTGGPLISVVTGTPSTSAMRSAASMLAGVRSFSKRQTDSAESCARRASSIWATRRFLRAWRRPVSSTINTGYGSNSIGSEIHSDITRRTPLVVQLGVE